MDPSLLINEKATLPFMHYGSLITNDDFWKSFGFKRVRRGALFNFLVSRESKEFEKFIETEFAALIVLDGLYAMLEIENFKFDNGLDFAKSFYDKIDKTMPLDHKVVCETLKAVFQYANNEYGIEEIKSELVKRIIKNTKYGEKNAEKIIAGVNVNLPNSLPSAGLVIGRVRLASHLANKELPFFKTKIYGDIVDELTNGIEQLVLEKFS